MIKNGLMQTLIVTMTAVCLWGASGDPLPAEAAKILQAHQWDHHVGNQAGLWVDATNQRLHLIQNRRILRSYRCSTGAAGMGNVRNSNKTPLGWHRVGAKIGDQLPVGAILKGRKWTKKIWQPGQAHDQDLVLTRILWLRGLEPGKNLGGNVDTWKRYIYIHGTNHPTTLGRPTSHGCVRLDPTEVIDLYNRVEKNIRVLITGCPPSLPKGAERSS